jgi:hypothetical protein
LSVRSSSTPIACHRPIILTKVKKSNSSKKLS